MDSRLLEAFRIVMDTQSMTGASKVLGLTQPAVSAQISKLECQVGFELFERVGSRLKPSVKGKWFYDEVIITLGALDSLIETARFIQGNSSKTLVVASHPSASISLIPGVVAKLRTSHPEARVRLINRMSNDVAGVFESGGCDIGIAQWPISVAGAENYRYKVKAVAIMPKGHPLAEHSLITTDHFSDLPFIECSETTLMNYQVQKCFNDNNASYQPIIQSEYFGTICQLVGAGSGVSIVDPWSAKSIAQQKIEVRPFEPDIFYEIAVFCRPASAQSPLVSEFLRQIDNTVKAGCNL